MENYTLFLEYKEMICEFIEQIDNVDAVLQLIQLHLLMQAIPISFIKNKVNITKLSNILKNKLFSYIEPNKCFANSDISCQILQGARYVLGFVGIDNKPIEHAWINYNSMYYDPTVHLYNIENKLIINGYYPVVELKYNQYCKLKKLVLRNRVPDLSTYFKSIGMIYGNLSM